MVLSLLAAVLASAAVLSFMVLLLQHSTWTTPSTQPPKTMPISKTTSLPAIKKPVVTSPPKVANQGVRISGSETPKPVVKAAASKRPPIVFHFVHVVCSLSSQGGYDLGL